MTEPTANVELPKKSSNSFYKQTVQFTASKSVPWAQNGFSHVAQEKTDMHEGM